MGTSSSGMAFKSTAGARLSAATAAAAAPTGRSHHGQIWSVPDDVVVSDTPDSRASISPRCAEPTAKARARSDGDSVVPSGAIAGGTTLASTARLLENKRLPAGRLSCQTPGAR